MRTNRNTANGMTIAGMGGYGCKAYDGPGTISPSIEDRHIAAIQAVEETQISTVNAAWDAPAEVDGATIPAGSCLFIKAASVTISAGSGFAYYGYGAVQTGGGG